MPAISGARAQLLINGKPVGYATGVNASEDITNVRVNVLGDIDSEEIVPTSRTVSVNCNFVRILNNSLADQGAWVEGGTDAVLAFPDLSIVIQDRTTGNTIWTIEGARCQTRNWSVDSGGIMSTNVSFEALKMGDETPV